MMTYLQKFRNEISGNNYIERLAWRPYLSQRLVLPGWIGNNHDGILQAYNNEHPMLNPYFALSLIGRHCDGFLSRWMYYLLWQEAGLQPNLLKRVHHTPQMYSRTRYVTGRLASPTYTTRLYNRIKTQRHQQLANTSHVSYRSHIGSWSKLPPSPKRAT